jgi:hypothetical protein
MVVENLKISTRIEQRQVHQSGSNAAGFFVSLETDPILEGYEEGIFSNYGSDSEHEFNPTHIPGLSQAAQYAVNSTEVGSDPPRAYDYASDIDKGKFGKLIKTW